jgi:hypothetical protein
MVVYQRALSCVRGGIVRLVYARLIDHHQISTRAKKSTDEQIIRSFQTLRYYWKALYTRYGIIDGADPFPGYLKFLGPNPLVLLVGPIQGDN